MHWETLIESAALCVRRSGRFLVTELLIPHRVFSTSARNGGQSEGIRYLVNHQSCEGSAHNERHTCLATLGVERYHDSVCGDLGLPPECVATMGTAANMNYATVLQRGDDDVSVIAIVTAGVQGNAACAGDPTTWREKPEATPQAALYTGTINVQIILNCPVTEGALARAMVTMTEGKTAALQQLAVRSLYSKELATGTTTDQFCIAAPISMQPPRRFTSTGIKLGEYIGTAARDATRESLRWTNGMEASYTRGIFHALGRYGVKEESFVNEMASYLDEGKLELLKHNRMAVMYEPLVSASAYAIASILDRCRHGVFPADVAQEALRQQAACLATSLSGKLDCWNEFHNRLNDIDMEHPEKLVLQAIALGWSSKWI